MIALVVALLSVTACSGTKQPEAAASDFEEGDPAILREAALRTAGLPFRYHSTLSVEGGEGGNMEIVGDVVEVVGLNRLLDIRGEVAGDDRAIKVKTSLIAGYLDGLDVGIPVDPIGLQTEARRIEGVWYVRAPRTLVVAALQEAGANLPVESDELDRLVSGWVRMDAGDRADEIDRFSRTALLGSESLQKVLDPIDLLAEIARTDAVEVAQGTFDGESVTVVRATIRLSESEKNGGSTKDRERDGGGDRGHARGSSTITLEDAQSAGTAGAEDGVPIRIEAAIGDDGLIRSVSYGITFVDMLSLVQPAGGGTDASFEDLRQVIRTNFHDVGSEGVVVNLPEVFSVVELDD